MKPMTFEEVMERGQQMRVKENAIVAKRKNDYKIEQDIKNKCSATIYALYPELDERAAHAKAMQLKNEIMREEEE